MAGAVLTVVHALPGWPGLLAGVGAGAGVFFLGLRKTRSLEAEDCERLRQWTGLLPKPIGRITLHLLAPQRGPDSTPGNAVAAPRSNQ